MIVRSKGGELEVGVSDPTQLQKEPVTVGLPMSVSAVSVGNPDVEVVSMSPLTLKVKVDGGHGPDPRREVQTVTEVAGRREEFLRARALPQPGSGSVCWPAVCI